MHRLAMSRARTCLRQSRYWLGLHVDHPVSAREHASHPHLATAVHARIETEPPMRSPFHQNGVGAPGNDKARKCNEIEDGEYALPLQSACLTRSGVEPLLAAAMTA